MCPPKRGSAWRPPLDRDAGVLASSLECPAAEVRAVVDVHHVRHAGDGPRLPDLAFPQTRRFVKDGMQQAQAGRQPGRCLHRKIEPR